MPDPLQRGAVVVRRARFSVVWDVSGEGLVLLPIIVPRTRWDYDVPLDLADLVGAGVTMAHSVVRPRRNEPIPHEGHKISGTLPGATMCRVVHMLVRAQQEAMHRAKWSNVDVQRTNADGRPVNLVK